MVTTARTAVIGPMPDALAHIARLIISEVRGASGVKVPFQLERLAGRHMERCPEAPNDGLVRSALACATHLRRLLDEYDAAAAGAQGAPCRRLTECDSAR